MNKTDKMDKTDRLLKLIITAAILAFFAVAIITMIVPKKSGAAPSGAGAPVGASAGGAPAGGGAAAGNAGSGSAGSGGTAGNRAAPTASSGDAASGAATADARSGSGNRAASAAGSGDTASGAATADARSGSGNRGATATAGDAASGAAAGNAGGGNRGGARAAITVSAKTIGDDTIRQIIKLNGDVSSQSAVNIYPETNGKIVRVLRKLGDNLTRGSVIAYIDPSRPGQAFAQNPVLATVSGTITSLNISLGETVTTQTAVATIGSLGNLKVTVYVAEKYSSYLKVGLSAELSFTTAPGEKFQAVVSSISPVVNSKTRTIETVLTLIDKDERIKQGMFAAVELVIREETDTIVVPSGAVKDYNGTTVVYIVDNNSIARRMTVTLGLKNDSESQIVEGVQNGDRVITAGTVTDGSTVKIAEKSL
ncbi:MAG: hypothetical protein Ta2A_21040 [Treponemataceae bacterium]|nr:MAG: hypothetical protein Ta2A_21040 [Treponemataceae bacterium]